MNTSDAIKELFSKLEKLQLSYVENEDEEIDVYQMQTKLVIEKLMFLFNKVAPATNHLDSLDDNNRCVKSFLN